MQNDVYTRVSHNLSSELALCEVPGLHGTNPPHLAPAHAEHAYGRRSLALWGRPAVAAATGTDTDGSFGLAAAVYVLLVFDEFGSRKAASWRQSASVHTAATNHPATGARRRSFAAAPLPHLVHAW